jgi:hypothetical protein
MENNSRGVGESGHSIGKVNADLSENALPKQNTIIIRVDYFMLLLAFIRYFAADSRLSACALSAVVWCLNDEMKLNGTSLFGHDWPSCDLSN